MLQESARTKPPTSHVTTLAWLLCAPSKIADPTCQLRGFADVQNPMWIRATQSAQRSSARWQSNHVGSRPIADLQCGREHLPWRPCITTGKRPGVPVRARDLHDAGHDRRRRGSVQGDRVGIDRSSVVRRVPWYSSRQCEVDSPRSPSRWRPARPRPKRPTRTSAGPAMPSSAAAQAAGQAPRCATSRVLALKRARAAPPQAALQAVAVAAASLGPAGPARPSAERAATGESRPVGRAAEQPQREGLRAGAELAVLRAQPAVAVAEEERVARAAATGASRWARSPDARRSSHTSAHSRPPRPHTGHSSVSSPVRDTGVAPRTCARRTARPVHPRCRRRCTPVRRAPRWCPPAAPSTSATTVAHDTMTNACEC